MGKKQAFFLAALAVLAFLTYANSLGNAFQYDDAHTIQGNPFVHDLSYFTDYFADGRTYSAFPENASYRPLSTAASALCWAIGGGRTWVFHLYKILGHILVAWLIFGLGVFFLKLELEAAKDSETSAMASSEQIAFLAAAFFVVHPANAETVNYISALSTLQCSLFYLSGFWFFLRAERRSIWFGAPMVLCFFCSVLSKEEGATFPAALTLYGLIYHRISPNRKKLWSLTAIAWVALAGFLVLYFQMSPEAGQSSKEGASRITYFLTQISAWAHYLEWIFKPWGYSLEHTSFGFIEHWYEARIWGAALVHLAVFGIAWKSRLRFLQLGVFWFYLVLLPSSSFFPLAEPMNEHRYYLSYALFFPALFYALFYWVSRLDFATFEWSFEGVSRNLVFLRVATKDRILKTLGLTAFLVFTVSTIAHNRVWKDTISLWSDTLQKDPANGRAYNNLGIAYLEKEQYDLALKQFLKCAEYWENYKYCYLNQHVTYLKLGRIPEAKAALEEMQKRDSNFVLGLWYVANFKSEFEKNPELGLEAAEKCDRISAGQYVPCLLLELKILKTLGRASDLVSVSLRVMPLVPENREVRFNMGMALIELQRFEEARAIFSELSKKDPRDLQSHFNWAWVENQLQNWTTARDLWLKHAAMDHSNLGVWANLKVVAEHLNDAVLGKRCVDEVREIQKGGHF